MRDRRATRVLLLGAAVAFGAGGCLDGGEDTGDEPDVGAAAQAVDGEVECAAADVTWPNPSDETRACAGPWIYGKYATETSASPFCPGEVGCSQYKECPHWVAQTPAAPSLTYNVNMNCTGPVNEPECEANWNLARSVCDQFKTEQTDLIEQPANQRVTESTSTLTMLSADVQHRTNRFKCQLTIKYDKQVGGRDPSCGCEIPIYPVCQHAVVVANPPVRVVTAAGKTKSQVRAEYSDPTPGQLTSSTIQPSCSTGEDQPSLPAKLARLLAGLADPQIAAPGSAVFDQLVRRAKLTYELFDAAAVAATSDATDAAVQGVYRDHPAVEPTCGRHAEVVADPCDDEADWRLRFCTRMSSAHVGGDLARHVYQKCVDQLEALADAIEGEVCPADVPYVAGSTEAHRRLHDKVMLRFGAELVDPATSQVADVADVLHLVDRWYAQDARILPDRPLGRELDLVSNKFWQAAHGFEVGAQEVGWIEQSLYADLRHELDEAADLPGDEARRAIDDAMDQTELRALELDRAVLIAAYSDAAPGERVLGDRPLLRLTADALAPLVARMDTLLEFHDAGCALLDCASLSAPTRLSRLWRVLAHLTAGPDADPSLADVVAATPGTMAGWKPVFQAMVTGQQRLLDAVADEDAEGRSDLLAIVDKSSARIASYDATGLFLPAVGDRLYTGVHANQRARVKDHLDDLHDILTDERIDIDNRLVSLVDGLVRVDDADTSRAQLDANEERLRTELDDLRARAASFRAIVSSAPQSEISVFEQLMAEWARIEGAIDEQSYLRVDDSVDLFLSAKDAHFEGWQGVSVADLGVHKIEVPSRQTISVATDGVWAPTCALRQARVVDADDIPDEVNGAPIDVGGALAGPEGYTVSWNGTAMQAVSTHGGKTERISAGVRGDLCVSSPGLTVTGNGAHVCLYMDASLNWERSRTWQNGTENRTSTQFSSGIFLPFTPLEAPAGSLVVVEMPPGQADPRLIRDVHLVRSPHTTIVVDGPADLYLVVNDLRCQDQDDLNRLHVAIHRFVGVGDAAKSLLTRMAYTTSLIRARIPELMRRGEVLPAEVTEIELAAKLDAINVPGEPQVAVDDYPAPLKDLFFKYVARDMKQLEASVRIANLEREIRIKEAEFHATDVALRNGAADGYLVSLLPAWTVRGLRLKELRDVASIYSTDLRYYLAPLLKVWYPQVLSDMSGLSAVEDLTAVDVDQPVLAMTDRLLEAGGALATRIEDADSPYPSPQDTAPSFVTLRFPEPSLLEPSCSASPSARCRRTGESATYRWATVAQTRALWDSLGRPDDNKTSRRLRFELSPEDIYEATSGSFYLSCTKSLPVVRRIGLGLTGFSASSLPPDQRALEGRIPATAPMAFVDATGVTSFEMANPSWRHLANVPLIYGTNDYNKVKTDFEAVAQDVRGVSPFTTFIFDIPETTVAAWNMRSAKTIDLIVELEAVRGNSLVAVPICTAAP